MPTLTEGTCRYEEVVRCCELAPDIAMLPAGDMTEIGEKVRHCRILALLQVLINTHATTPLARIARLGRVSTCPAARSSVFLSLVPFTPIATFTSSYGPSLPSGARFLQS